jgi:hypothetical protein
MMALISLFTSYLKNNFIMEAKDKIQLTDEKETKLNDTIEKVGIDIAKHKRLIR